MVSMWVDHCRVLVLSYEVVVRPRSELNWHPPLEDRDGWALVDQTAKGQCPVGVLADYIEERYPYRAELASMLRRGKVDGV